MKDDSELLWNFHQHSMVHIGRHSLRSNEGLKWTVTTTAMSQWAKITAVRFADVTNKSGSAAKQKKPWALNREIRGNWQNWEKPANQTEWNVQLNHKIWNWPCSTDSCSFNHFRGAWIQIYSSTLIITLWSPNAEVIIYKGEDGILLFNVIATVCNFLNCYIDQQYQTKSQ